MSLQDVGLLTGAYLLGAVPFGYLIARLRSGKDIRTLGSGNIGATNVLRTQGRGWGVLTLLLDAGKGAAAVLACAHLSGLPWMGAAGGFAAVVGHCFPVFLGFRGGKGVATGLGAFLLLAPLATLVALAVFLATVVISRWVSLGSILAALSFGVALFVLHGVAGLYPRQVPWIGAGMAVLLVTRHHSNIRKLVAGTEPPLWGDGGGKP